MSQPHLRVAMMSDEGILSPILFSLYVDDLSRQRKACQTGCMVSNLLVNHITYADIVVFSVSSGGLQPFLFTCFAYGVGYDFKHNGSNGAVMICKMTNAHI